MKHIYIVLIFIICCITSCQNKIKSTDNQYLRWVGDISFDPKLDQTDFVLCDERNIKQYHNFSLGMCYNGEKIAIDQHFKQKYISPKKIKQSGLIRIRFIVNCKGKTDRFRILSIDENYKPFSFNRLITEQILELTKSLSDWTILPNTNKPEDYYQYLIFKINEGNITEILP